jgi:hypothetical protein
VETGPKEMVKIVIADNVSSPGPVTARMERSRISGFPADAIHFVELDQMVVSPQGNCLVRCIVDEIVLHTLSNPLKQKSILSRSHPQAVMVDVIV